MPNALVRKSSYTSNGLSPTIKEYHALAGLGPWTALSEDVWLFRILYQQGRYREVYDGVKDVLATAETLPNPPTGHEVVEPWGVCEVATQLAALSARKLKEWQNALAYNRTLVEMLRQRGDT